MTESEAIIQAWQWGIVAPWYLRPDQLPIYELLIRHKRPFIECARRFGKTTSILCYVIERLIQNPGWVCLWCEPDKNQAREIIKPEIEKLFSFAPVSMAPEWSSEDSFYWLPSTGPKARASKLKLRGVNHDLGNSARGPFANIVVSDEYGFWKDPRYTIREAIAPQLQTTRGQLIKASTPPGDLGHPYYDEKGSAINGSRFIQKTIYDNQTITKPDLDQIIEDCGGMETPAFQREYLCQPVADPESLVIPEYHEDRHDIPDDTERPEAFDAYVGMDLGLNDATAGLFAYVDFLKRTVVIDDEWVASGKNTKEITDACKDKEQALWPGRPIYMRWGDNELQQLYDMNTLHGYVVSPTRKDDKLAALNELRLLFSQGRIKIKKRCKALRYQLKVGLWNSRRTEFQRGEKIGHLDAIDALIYLCRNIVWNHNPYPDPYAVIDIYKQFPKLSPGSEQTENDVALDAAFDPFASGA